MHIEYSGLITLKEYQQVFALHYKNPLILFFKIISILSLPGLFIFLLLKGGAGDVTSYFLYLLPVFLLFGFVWLTPLQVTRSYLNPRNFFNQPLHGSIDSENGFSIVTSLSTGSMGWNGFVGYRHKDNLILLYQNKNCFNILTRNLFASDEDWNALLAFLNTRYPQGAKSIK
jgi:hypothetical protein